jgi:predicted secreted protein
MRQLADIPHPEVKITLFSWNGKYLIKLEKGPFEQTYKVSEMDVTSDEEVRTLLDEEFLRAVIDRFQQMRQDLQATFERHDIY